MRTRPAASGPPARCEPQWDEQGEQDDERPQGAAAGRAGGAGRAARDGQGAGYGMGTRAAGAEQARAAQQERVARGESGVVHDWTALALPATPRAAGSFRRHALDAIRRWGLHDESGEIIEACVSELVTNAIVHGVGRDVLMVLYYTGDSVLTEVFGQAVDEPVIPATARSDNAEGGRGLLIVETLAKDWGSEHTGRGLLRVWASIAVFGASGHGQGPGPGRGHTHGHGHGHTHGHEMGTGGDGDGGGTPG